jgi:hypothetical protein
MALQIVFSCFSFDYRPCFLGCTKRDMSYMMSGMDSPFAHTLLPSHVVTQPLLTVHLYLPYISCGLEYSPFVGLQVRDSTTVVRPSCPGVATL